MRDLCRTTTAFLAGFLALAGMLDCSHFPAAPHPLYAGPVQPPEQTATLGGYVAKVDDVNVSHQQGPFALLPGCHVVTVRTSVGDGSPSGAWSAVMPQLVFAFRMQAAHAYEVQVQRQGGGSETGGLKMRAVEMDASGKKLAEVPPVHTKADIEACLAWAAEQSQ